MPGEGIREITSQKFITGYFWKIHMPANRKYHIWIIFLGITLLLSGCGDSIDEHSQLLVLVNGRLINGTGADPIPNAVIIIKDGHIATVGSHDDVEIPDGAQVIDVGGGTILPGFINAHVHDSFEEENLIAWAQGGVTTVRDEQIHSDLPLDEVMALRDDWNSDPHSARLISAGYMLTVPGGYGKMPVTSPADTRQTVLDELAAGVDLIKLSMEDGYAGTRGLPKLSDEELDAIISTAHEQGALVSGHVTQAKYLEILVEAGVDDIAHIPYDLVSTDAWQQMVAKNIYMTPTFTVYRNFNAPVSVCVNNLRNFITLGGKVALGNDYGGGPGEFELGIPMYEIEKMSEAGMTPMQIIVASTLNAAHVSGIEEQLGTLEAGKIADVLVLRGDPLKDLEALKDIQLVIHEGIIIRGGDQP
jgi:imidazolonepropionase-like amidohydrolase